MNLKIKDAVSWGRFVAIFGFITSGFTMLSFVGIPIGVIMLLGYIKLNNATDELKKISEKTGELTTGDYEDVLSLYGKYFKLIGIGTIVSIVMSIIGIIFYILFFMALFAGYSGYTSY